MPYTTWTAVAEKVEGEKKLLEFLQPHGDTASVHPYFDAQVAIADGEIDRELERAGYVTPLTSPLADVVLANAAIGLVLDHVTEGSDRRQEFIDKLAAFARKYIKRIGDGEIKVTGAEVDGDGSSDPGFFGTPPDDPYFDIALPGARALDVFADLSVPYRRRF